MIDKDAQPYERNHPYSSDEDEDDLYGRQPKQHPSSSSRSRYSGSSDEETDTDSERQSHRGGVLQPRSREHRQKRRITYSQGIENMSPANGTRGAAKAGRPQNPSGSGKESGNPAKKTTGKPLKDKDKQAARAAKQEQRRKEREAAERQAKELERLKAELAEQKAKNANPKTGKPAKSKVSIPSVNVPIVKYKVIQEYVDTEIWRNCKFVSDASEVTAIAKKIIDNMDEFKSLRSDDETVAKENAAAVYEAYGKSAICKAINNRRTNVANSLKKEYAKRYVLGHPMPTPKELLHVILRKDLVLQEVPEDATEEQSQEIQAKNKEIQRNQDWFMWYWESLLPCVTGKYNWGHNIRNYVTISKGTHPNDSTKKYITSTDEALVAVIMENCEKRFPYTAELFKQNITITKDHRGNANYRARYSDAQSGQSTFGGWNLAGRSRFGQIRKAIVSAKRKDHVDAMEKEILRLIREKNKPGGKKRKSGVPMDFEGVAEAKVSFLDVDSDDETVGEDDMDIGDAGDDFLVPKPKKAKEN